MLLERDFFLCFPPAVPDGEDESPKLTFDVSALVAAINGASSAIFCGAKAAERSLEISKSSSTLLLRLFETSEEEGLSVLLGRYSTVVVLFDRLGAFLEDSGFADGGSERSCQVDAGIERLLLLDLSSVIFLVFFSSKDPLDDSSTRFLSSEDLLMVSFSKFLSSEAFLSASLSFLGILSFSLLISFDDSWEWIPSDSLDFTLRLKAELSTLLLLLSGDLEADLDEAAERDLLMVRFGAFGAE